MERNIMLVRLDSNGLQLYNSTNSRLYSFVATPVAIRDGELVNLGVLELKLKTFLEENKISPTHLFFILSQNIIYEKDFAPNAANLEEEIKNYIDSVPFENVASKTYNLNNNLKVAVFNADLFEGVKNIFTNYGFTIDGFAPYFLVNPTGSTDSLDQNTASFILKNYDSLTAAPTKSQTTPKSRLAILLFVFFILFVLMLILLLRQTGLLIPKKTTTLTQQVVPTIPLSPTAVATTSSSINEQITIKIQSYKEVMAVAQKLQSQLIQSGFLKTEIEMQATSSAEKTTVTFATTVPSSIRNVVINTIKAIFDNIIIQEIFAPKFDVLISIAKL